MSLAQILERYRQSLTARYPVTPEIAQAISAITQCRTEELGSSRYHCPDCDQAQCYPLSCGHRHCPRCQQSCNADWLEKQQQKLLPVHYYLITFTLPYQLRRTLWAHQKAGYQGMFSIAAQLLKDFAARTQGLAASPGFTVVLHTHDRKLNYHPHLHVLLPGGGYDAAKQCWVKKRGKYLFNQTALANVWRARILAWFNQQQWSIPTGIPATWVVNCKKVGYGLPALKYLARYLYRGVFNEDNILSECEGKVTYQYKDSQTRQMTSRAMDSTSFLWQVMQHVLPKGFHRCRDYGLLRGNNKVLLRRIQLMLNATTVVIEGTAQKKPTVCLCPHCQHPMQLVGVFRRR